MKMAGEPIVIRVAGEPVAKGRPRVTRQGFAYTPAKTRKYEAHVRLAAQMAMKGRPPLAGPVACDVLAVMKIPVSFSKKKTADAIAGKLLPAKRPDLDNLVKAATDACNSIVFLDDSQVVSQNSLKRYGTTPQLVITVRDLNVENAQP